jgi:predicted GNAT family acetyltransferase
MEIRHEADRRRFVTTLAGGETVLEYSERPDGVLVYRHTFTPPALRGQGIAGAVVLFALDYARANDKKIEPTCPFVKRVLRKHPEYADLVAADAAAGDR